MSLFTNIVGESTIRQHGLYRGVSASAACSLVDRGISFKLTCLPECVFVVGNHRLLIEVATELYNYITCISPGGERGEKGGVKDKILLVLRFWVTIHIK